MTQFENNSYKAAVAIKALRFDEAAELGKWLRDVFTDREGDSDRSDPLFWAELVNDWADAEIDEAESDSE